MNPKDQPQDQRTKITKAPTPRHPDPLDNRTASKPPCAVDQCGRRCYALRWCRAHYERYCHYGDLFADVPIRRGVRFGATGYSQAHQRVIDLRGPASDQPCVECGAGAVDWCYDHADPDELVDSKRGSAYSLDVTHYRARCKACHRRADHVNRLVKADVSC